MAVAKMGLTPHPAVARAESGITAITSAATFKPQFRLPQFPFNPAWLVPLQDGGRQLANILVTLLTPAAVIAFVMAVWRVGQDIGFTGAFVVGGGLFSHWQVWLALAIALQALSSTLVAWISRTARPATQD